MEQNFGKMEGVKFISDDIIIFAKTESELLERLKVVFKKIIELGMKLNKKKCVFAQKEINFFGIKITEHGISPDPDKISSIKNAIQ